jgi:hypothetical protein
MKKIMFNDRCGLTQAVLEGQKTMTRRIAEKELVEDENCELRWNGKFRPARFKVGEVVAVAQRYCDIYKGAMVSYQDESTWDIPMFHPGWNNKMFVQADLMPHHIRITDVRVERLRDINSEDCLKEGIEARIVGCHTFYFAPGIDWPFDFPKPAFAALIKRISGKGTWESNPWVYVYTFELVK